ncbi:unnamed protein product, partial [marine sediment metagenome]
MLSETPNILDAPGRPKTILRHDVDVSLEKALKIAEIENSLDV